MQISSTGLLHKIETHDVQNGTCSIPDYVQCIGYRAFTGIEGLTNVNLPGSVREIGSWAFEKCDELTTVTIPSSVTQIGTGAFKWCTRLTNITIPPTLTAISESAFASCTSLTEITIPASVEAIGMGAFADCTSLTEITIPNGIRALLYRTFTGCAGLTQVTIPLSVEIINGRAFAGCTGLTEITIPSAVTHIGNEAFAGCAGLTKVTIPSSLTHIGNEVFAGCNHLKVIVIDALNDEEYQRLIDLLPQTVRHLSKPSWALKVTKEVIETLEPIGISSFPKQLPESVISLIQQMEGRLNNALEEVRSPHRLDELEPYKNALKEAARRFREEQETLVKQIIEKEQEPANLRLVAVSKLAKYIQITEATIERVGLKNPHFFNSLENKEKLKDCHDRIAIARKLIAWLGGDETIRFTQDEKGLLSTSKNAVGTILRNAKISADEIPLAPSPRSGGFCTIM